MLLLLEEELIMDGTTLRVIVIGTCMNGFEYDTVILSGSIADDGRTVADGQKNSALLSVVCNRQTMMG